MKIEEVLTKKEIKYMAGVRKGQEITIERHIIDGKSVKVKKKYISEILAIKENPDNEFEKWFKKKLKAKKILKYEKDEYSFRWIVWYV